MRLHPYPSENMAIAPTPIVVEQEVDSGRTGNDTILTLTPLLLFFKVTSRQLGATKYGIGLAHSTPSPYYRISGRLSPSNLLSPARPSANISCVWKGKVAN